MFIANWSSYARRDATKLMLIISKINSSWASLTSQSRNVWTMRRRYQFLQRSSFSFKLFTNIVTRFVAAIQSLYLYVLNANCCNPIVFLLIPLFLYEYVFGRQFVSVSLKNSHLLFHAVLDPSLDSSMKAF